MPNVNRRQVVVGLLGLPVALLTLPGGLQAAGQSYFIHGVASGDPTHDSVVLWTRIESDQPVDVAWELAQDAGFRKIVRQGVFSTNLHRYFTVKVVADQLKQ